MFKGINVSRSPITHIDVYNPVSIGASYTHIESLEKVIGPDTKKIVMYHSYITSLVGLEKSDHLEMVYMGFNRIYSFREEDSNIKNIDVLDLAGNPITSLVNCPPCKTLIVSATKIKNLIGCPNTVEIIRCGHSDYITSLIGCPPSVKLIECSCAPNLLIENMHLPDNVELLHD